MDIKEQLGNAIADRMQAGQVIGVGTGTTVDAALKVIAARTPERRDSLAFVTSSLQSAWRCEELGLRVLTSSYAGKIDWGFDGADLVDDRLMAIKGKGGAMLEEKILAVRAGTFLIAVDDGKYRPRLSGETPIPVEVVPTARFYVQCVLEKMGASAIALRSGSGKHGPTVTERGNLILDATFDTVSGTLERDIKAIVGVVESGLFTDHAAEILIGSAAGIKSITR